jgi:uncharacterized protein YoxC
MQPWVQIVLIVCALALTAALVAAILAARATFRHAASVLEIVEQELRPLLGQMHGLTDDVRDLTRETRREVERIGEVTEHVETAADGVGRIVVALAGLTRAGQAIGLVAGIRRGVDVFVDRLRGNQGGNHGR